MAEAVDYKYIGTRPVRPDGVDKVTGRAQFGADMNMPGMLEGCVLRSPHAHARIRSIDTSAAEALPGVLAVITGADFPGGIEGGAIGGEGGGDITDMAVNVMARNKVLYHGHPVAAVAATSEKAARDALQAIKVDYEVLTPVLDLDAALADDVLVNDAQHTTNADGSKSDAPSNVATVMKIGRGDLEQGFAEADVIVERSYRTPTVHQGYIEPHACVARINEDGMATVWCSTQGHFEVRNYISKLLQLDLDDVKVIPSEIGGGFGGKTVVYLEPLALKLSQKSGRPIKMTMSREEVFRASGPASASRSHVKIGARKDGTITAMQMEIDLEAGAFPGSPMGPAVMCAFTPYNCPNMSITGRDVLVNKPKVAAYRAPGAPQSLYATECAVSELAEQLGMDQIELRLKNAVKEGDVAPYGPKFPRIGLIECLEAARAHPHYGAPLAEGQGRGIAVGFWFNVGMVSSATVRINENGTVSVTEGNPDIGGSRASMALMAAETLGVPYEKVHVLVGDTESTGFCNVTGGSRTTFATGMAVIEASKKVIAELKQRAAATWNVDEDMVEWEDGQAVPRPGQNIDVQPLSLADIAGKAPRTGGPIGATASLNASGAGAGFSVNICDVEVDRETGYTRVLRFTCIQDAGKAIHPSYVEGQMQGGAAQGLGWALNEEYVYNADGVMENAGFLDYRIPVASDLPMIDTQIIEVPNSSHPYGVRGVGETPIVAPLAAAANAVSASAGVRITDLPLSPPKVLEAIDNA